LFQRKKTEFYFNLILGHRSHHEKQKPILQIETGGPPKIIVFNLMKELGYIQYGVYKNKLIRNFPEEIESGDYIFIHGSSEIKIANNLMNSNSDLYPNLQHVKGE